jgi:hypothetical protein
LSHVNYYSYIKSASDLRKTYLIKQVVIMTMQIMSSGSFSPDPTIQPISPQPDYRPDLNDILTPEQKNTVQHGINDKIAEQVENVKSNYQTAKDIDLMQAYYQQQQKVFDIYLQTSTDVESTSQPTNDINAVSTLTDTYADLYALHQNVKDGVGNLPTVPVEQGDIKNYTESTISNDSVNSNTAHNSASSLSGTLSNKQLDAYNSLMMPSTSNYMHLSA